MRSLDSSYRCQRAQKVCGEMNDVVKWCSSNNIITVVYRADSSHRDEQQGHQGASVLSQMGRNCSQEEGAVYGNGKEGSHTL